MRALALALLFLALLPLPTLAQGPTGLEGMVVNGTAGAATPQGLEVVLQVRHPSGRLERFTARTGPEGRFRFPQAPRGEGLRYRLSTEYQGVPYSLEWEGEPPSPLALHIFETTDSPEGLRLPEATIVVMGAEGARRTVSVLTVVLVENPGDRTFRPQVGEGRPPLKPFFPLPWGVEGLGVQTTLPKRGHVMTVPGGVVFFLPVPPGQAEIMLSFQAPYEGSRWSFPFTPDQEMRRLRLLVVEGLGQVNEDTWGPGRQVRVGFTVYRMYETGPIPPGEIVDIIMEGLPQPSLGQRVVEVLGSAWVGKGVVVGGVVLGLVGVLGYGLWRGPARERERLLEALARLEDQRARGEIGEEEYRRQRARLREALVNRGLGEGEGGESGTG